MTLDEMIRLLSDRNLSEISRRTGLSRQLIWSIASGNNTNPTLDTFRRIEAYLLSTGPRHE